MEFCVPKKKIPVGGADTWQQSAKSSAGSTMVLPWYYHGDGSKIVQFPWPW